MVLRRLAGRASNTVKHSSIELFSLFPYCQLLLARAGLRAIKVPKRPDLISYGGDVFLALMEKLSAQDSGDQHSGPWCLNGWQCEWLAFWFCLYHVPWFAFLHVSVHISHIYSFACPLLDHILGGVCDYIEWNGLHGCSWRYCLLHAAHFDAYIGGKIPLRDALPRQVGGDSARHRRCIIPWTN